MDWFDNYEDISPYLSKLEGFISSLDNSSFFSIVSRMVLSNSIKREVSIISSLTIVLVLLLLLDESGASVVIVSLGSIRWGEVYLPIR